MRTHRKSGCRFAQLTEWLRDTTTDTPPPLRPAVGVVEEPVPPELRAMDPDVLQPFLDAGLKDSCDKFGICHQGVMESITKEPMPSTLTPSSEW